MTIVFRCDAGHQIGTGHLIRCRTLARQLRRHGAECLFLCRQKPGDLIALISPEFASEPLPPLSPSDGTWLGCSQHRDAHDSLAALARAQPDRIDWLVVDHYSLDARWHQHVLEQLQRLGHRPRLLVIDDLADRPLMADLLLDQNQLNPAEAEELYKPLIPAGCRRLFGPAYALLGEAYSLLHPLLPERCPPLQRLLICFGGSDPANLSECCLEGLLHPAPLPLKLDLVLGPAYPHRDRIQALATTHPQLRVHGPQASLAGLMAQADLALGAGGVTSWERACLGLPALVSSLAANQNAVIAQLVAAGAVIDLGAASQLTPAAVRQAVQQLLDAPAQLAQLSRSAREITDGFGAPRVASAMLGTPASFDLRPAEAADEAIWLRWANDPAVRAASFHSDRINAMEHRRWFSAKLADPGALLLLGHAIDGMPIGYVRFEQISPSEIREQLLSIALEPAVRGQGLGLPLLERAIAFLQQRWQGPLELLAEVKPSNRASIRLFEAAGFEPSLPRRTGALCYRRISR